jgi:beta-glucosidase
MTAYNELSGVPGMINKDVEKVVKQEWGAIFTVTDGGDFCQNVNHHKYSASHAETVALALKAGINIFTEYSTATITASVTAALKSGLITEKDIDKAISETLTGRFMLGEFDPPEMNPHNDYSDDLINCDEFKKVNARAARECITLLKNDGILPIKGKNPKIAVVGLLGEHGYKDWYTGISSYNTTILSGLRKKFGKNVEFHDGCNIIAIKSVLTNRYLSVKSDGRVVADSAKITKACRFKKIDWDGQAVYISELNGKLLYLNADDSKCPLTQAHTGFVDASGTDTYEWFGRMVLHTDNYDVCDTYKSWRKKDIAVLEDGRLGEVECGAMTSAKMFKEEILVDGFDESVRLAKKADYVIVCLGNDPMVPARECFDRTSLNFPFLQWLLVDGCMKVNKNTILTITSSYPYTFFNEDIPAIIYTAHGGPESGDAMSDVLAGDYNPAGRLSQTWYRDLKDLPSIKDYDIMYSKFTYQYFEGEALYPFGHGLSYSKFEYSDFAVSDKGKDIEITLKVKNTSKIDGEEVVQVYFTALNPRVKRPKKQLCEFIRVPIEAGKTADLTLTFSKDRLRFWDVSRHKFAVETGEYRFAVGASSEDIRATVDLKVKGEKIPSRDLRKVTAAIDFDDRRSVELRYDKLKERHYIHAPVWNGALDFYDVDLKAVTGIEVSVSMNMNEGTIGVFVDDIEVGQVEIPAAACPTEFKKRKVKFEKPLKGKGKLTLRIPEHCNLLEIKLT